MFSLPPSPRYSEIRLVECCAGQYRPWVVRWRCYLLLLQSPTNTQFSIGTRFYILKIFFFSPVLISALIKFFKSSFFIQIIFKIWIFFCCKNWPISASRQGRRGRKKDNQFGKTLIQQWWSFDISCSQVHNPISPYIPVAGIFADFILGLKIWEQFLENDKLREESRILNVKIWSEIGVHDIATSGAFTHSLSDLRIANSWKIKDIISTETGIYLVLLEISNTKD